MRPANLSSPARTSLLALLLAFPSAHAQEQIDPERIEEVVVTATRTEERLLDVPASISVQDVLELRRNGFTFGSDEYRGVTGVFVRRGEGDADEFPFVSFRGSTGTEGSVSLVDGIPFIGLFEEVQLNEIPYDAVEQIEIVKGPVSALYGRGALYGATNYITRTPDENAFVARVTGGSDNYYRVDASLERSFGERGGILVAGSYEDYEGWREHARRRIGNLFAKGQFALGSDTTMGIYVNYNDRDTELPNGRALDADGSILDFDGGDTGFLGFEDPNNDTQNFLAALNLEHFVSQELSLAAKGSYRRIDREVFLNFFDPFGRNLDAGIIGYNGFRGDTTQDVVYGELTMRWNDGRHDVVAGVTGERSESTELNFWTGQNGFTFECGFTFYLVEVDAQTGEVLNADHPCFVVDQRLDDREFENTFWGAFVQDKISLTERLTLTLGIRFDDFSRDASFNPIDGVTPGGDQSGDADAFSPKATLSYRTDWGQYYVAYGRGFNSNFGASFEWNPVQYARPEARPTTIDSIEFGVKGRFLEDRISAEAIVFYSEQEDRRQIVNNPAADGDFSQPPNLITFGDLYTSRGIELSLVAEATDSTTLRANYTYLDPEWDEFSVSTFSGSIDFSGNTPVGVPDHLLYLQVDQRLGRGFSLRGIVEYYSDYYYTVDNEFEDGGYSLLTLGARIEPEVLRGFAVDLTLTNALDENYYSYFGNRTSPTYAVPGPPRQLRMAITGRF
ncbi:MAG: TonB-dependent receptor [Pseudomonadota bacterium]